MRRQMSKSADTTPPLGVADLYMAQKFRKKVFFHSTFLAFARHLGEGDKYRVGPVRILRLYEEAKYPDVLGVYYEQDGKPGYLTIKPSGEFPTKDAVPVFRAAPPKRK